MRFKVGTIFSGRSEDKDENFTGTITEVYEREQRYMIDWSDIGPQGTFSERELDDVFKQEKLFVMYNPDTLPEDLFEI